MDNTGVTLKPRDFKDEAVNDNEKYEFALMRSFCDYSNSFRM